MTGDIIITAGLARVAVGALLDTFIVRSILVPALTFDISRVIWWPSRQACES